MLQSVRAGELLKYIAVDWLNILIVVLAPG